MKKRAYRVILAGLALPVVFFIYIQIDSFVRAANDLSDSDTNTSLMNFGAKIIAPISLVIVAIGVFLLLKPYLKQSKKYPPKKNT